MAVTISKRVFCIGMNKTGTSTMKHCFEQLNLSPIAAPKTYTKEVRKKINHFYDHKSYHEMLELAEHYQAFEDRPWNMWSMYRHLHERFPDSKFILTVRDPESWWRSTEHWVTVAKPEVLKRYQLHLRVHQPSKESMIESYLRYNQEVEEYFRGTGQLLVVNLEQGDGWDKLCNFLDLPVPKSEFPHANRQKYTPVDAVMLKRKRRLKHGVECQACKNLTIVKSNGVASKKKNSSRGQLFLETILPKRMTKKPKQVRSEGIQSLLLVRRILYKLYKTIRPLKDILYNHSKSEKRTFNTALPDKELAVVSCFFNPGRSQKRVKNFKAFLRSMKDSGVRCLVVELAFGSNPFEIVDHDDVIQVRGQHVMWHKERLLNIGIRRLLDDGVRKIAWLDGDILFEDKNWPLEIANRLENSNLCQVFDTISIQTHEGEPPMIAPSAVKYFRQHGSLYSQHTAKGRKLFRGIHKGGQSGFGWAARAEVLEKELLFEHAVVGGGDKLIFAASLTEDVSGSRLKQMTYSKIKCKPCGHNNKSDAYTENFIDWAQRWSEAVGSSVDYARLHIRDMYHGKRSDRAYTARHDILYKHEFNPITDLKSDASDCFQWAPGKDQLQQEIEAYFLSRREDV